MTASGDGGRARVCGARVRRVTLLLLAAATVSLVLGSCGPETAEELPLAAGRRLSDDRSAVAGWRDITSSALHLRMQVPPEWREEPGDAHTLRVNSPKSDAFVLATVLPAPEIKPPAATPQDVLLQGARLQLQRGEIAGYEIRRLGAAVGVLVLSAPQPAGGDSARWSTYIGDPKAYQLLTILISTAGEGAQAVPVLAGIVHSIRVD